MAKVAEKNWLEAAEERAAQQAATSEAQRAVRVVIEQRLGTTPPDLDSAISALDLEHARRALTGVVATSTVAEIRTALGA